MTRVAPYAQQDMILFHTLRQQENMFDRQIQLATGLVSQDYAGISNQANRLVSTETAINRTTQFTANIDIVEQRLSLMDLAMESLDTLARDFRKTLNAAVDGPESHVADLRDLADNTLALVSESLNSRDGTRYLFGGARVDRPPVSLAAGTYSHAKLIEEDAVTVDQTFYDSYYEDVLGNTLPYAQGSFYQQIYFDKNGVLPTVPAPADLNNPTLTEFNAEDPGLWEYYVNRLDSAEMTANPKTDYYQGDDIQNRARIDEAFEVSYGVQANETSFQRLLMAADAIASMPSAAITTPEGLTLMTKARDMLEDIIGVDATNGIEGLSETRVKLNGPRLTLESVRDRHVQFSIYAGEIVADIQNINEAEVISRLQSDQIQLQASFSTISRLQSLSLLNFLN